MTGPLGTEPPAERLTIAERAAKRDRMAASGRDRYASLLRQLQAGQELPIGTARGARYEWHPIFWRLLAAVFVVVVAWFVLRAGVTIWRDNTTDTWAGPDATVQSGQRLEGCPAVGIIHDDAFPSWIRYGGHVFVLANARRPVVAPTAENGYTETGYANEGRLLIGFLGSDGAMRSDQLLIYDPGASVGELYRALPECD